MTGVSRRARSEADKPRRAEDLLEAATALAADGGVRHITLAAVAERAGLHRSGIRRYFASREELLLELAERAWGEWRDILTARLTGQHDLSPADSAQAISVTIVSLPLFCDLLTHIPLGLAGDAELERARRYEANSFAAYDVIVGALRTVSTMRATQVEDLIAAALGLVHRSVLQAGCRASALGLTGYHRRLCLSGMVGSGIACGQTGGSRLEQTGYASLEFEGRAPPPGYLFVELFQAWRGANEP